MRMTTGCAGSATIDDYAVNDGYELKGSSYTYTHDIGIQGMQQNLGLSDSQIIRKNNVSDTDAEATRKAIKECIDAGCNVIFTTSWGYMQTTAEMAEEYPDIYFSHGTGYMSNGKNFNNYFGRIYQARYLSGIVAGMNTKTNKIGYVAAMGTDNSEVTGGIDAFALGIYSVNPDAKVYVKVTNSRYDPQAEEAAARTLLNMNCDVIAQHCDTVYPQTLAQEKVNEAKQQILTGKNGVFDGVIETNTGATVGTAGKTLDDSTITGGINWYFKTVNVVE